MWHSKLQQRKKTTFTFLEPIGSRNYWAQEEKKEIGCGGGGVSIIGVTDSLYPQNYIDIKTAWS